MPATACIGIEDSSNGIRAAAAAGMTVIAIPNPVYPPQPDALALCAKIATSPDDVRRFLIEWLPDRGDGTTLRTRTGWQHRGAADEADAQRGRRRFGRR